MTRYTRCFAHFGPCLCSALLVPLVLGVVGCGSKPATETKEAATVEEAILAKSAPLQGPTATTNAASTPLTDMVLLDRTAQSGIDFVHAYDAGGRRHIAEVVASGLASMDYDLDGLIDLYFLNGSAIGQATEPGSSNALFRNLGGFAFRDVTQAARLDTIDFSLGVATADYDNDGFEDIYVNNYGNDHLWHNNGDGTYTDVTLVAGLADGEHRELVAAGACFFDVNADGNLDLYVGNYVVASPSSDLQKTTDGYESYPGPLDFQPADDFLYLNDGHGSFKNITRESGIDQLATTTMGVISTDVEGDGDADIFVVNDVQRNTLFANDGSGKFEEIGIQCGLAFSHDARRNGNMGVDCGDFDRDGVLDFYTTTFSNDVPVLYHGDGLGSFVDRTAATGAGAGLLPHVNWGTAFIDLENDGDLDLFIANGHTEPNVSKWAFNTAWKVKNTVLMNVGDRFVDVSDRCGPGLDPVESSRGVVADDFDNDGRVDLLVLNSRTRPTLIRNATGRTGNWLALELRGARSCRDGTGARVTLRAGDREFVAEIHSGRSYQSSFGKRLHFGLGTLGTIDEIQIRWPSGVLQRLPAPAANRLHWVHEPST